MLLCLNTTVKAPEKMFPCRRRYSGSGVFSNVISFTSVARDGYNIHQPSRSVEAEDSARLADGDFRYFRFGCLIVHEQISSVVAAVSVTYRPGEGLLLLPLMFWHTIYSVDAAVFESYINLPSTRCGLSFSISTAVKTLSFNRYSSRMV